ncbi:MAG: molybdate ABC transporter substrate-binding protein [Halobacteriovoraceae bacterium]|nr:molybdate ABC transporter substrate-binding protein [Halobacteriovoraceae bacterium]
MFKKVKIAFLMTFSSMAFSGTVHIGVASNFIKTMQSLIVEFEKKTTHQVIASYASSGKLYTQILNNAPYDIFMSADQLRPQQLIQKDMAIKDSNFSYAQGQLLLISIYPKLNLQNIDEFITNKVKRISMANPKFAPYGRAAKEFLENNNFYIKNKSKIILGENVSQAIHYMSSGNVDMSLVGNSQWQSLKEKKEFHKLFIPENNYNPIFQDVILLKKASQNEAALSFLNFLKSEKAKQIIKSFGYKI